MTKAPKRANAGQLATQASGPPRDMLETDEVKQAQAAFADARVAAEGRKQSAIGAAMVIKDVAAHVAAIRAAEETYHLELARAAQVTSIIDAAGYLAAAAAG